MFLSRGHRQRSGTRSPGESNAPLKAKCLLLLSLGAPRVVVVVDNSSNDDDPLLSSRLRKEGREEGETQNYTPRRNREEDRLLGRSLGRPSSCLALVRRRLSKTLPPCLSSSPTPSLSFFFLIDRPTGRPAGQADSVRLQSSENPHFFSVSPSDFLSQPFSSCTTIIIEAAEMSYNTMTEMEAIRRSSIEF